MRGSSELHAKCIQEILLATNEYAVLFKNPVGVGKCLATGNVVQYGLCKGSTDLVGWLKSKVPVFIALEIKTGAAVLNPNQIRFQKICERDSVPHLVVRYEPGYLDALCTRLRELIETYRRPLLK